MKHKESLDVIGDAELNGKSLDQFHHLSKYGTPTSVFDFKVFEFIKDNYSIFVCGFPYVYSGGVYHPDRNGTKVKQIIRGLLYEQFIKSRVINSIYTLIVDAEELQKDFSELNNFPTSYINFRDCMVDAKTLKEVPHSPEYLTINQLPYLYSDVKQAINGKEMEQFLGFIFDRQDDRKMLLEYAGLCFTADTSQQKFLIICGLGGTGKSVLIRLIETAVGIDNISNVSMQELSRRFATSILVGKLLNSCADLSNEALEDDSTIKKLLGEDMMSAERKGENAFMFRNYARLIFSTNMLPLIRAERTNGFYRRLLVLKMDRQPEKQDTELASKLIKEIHYFIRISVLALHEMYQKGSITVSKNSEQAVMQMRSDSDVVEGWIENCCTMDTGLKIERGAAFADFIKYCSIEERQPLTKNGFFRALRAKGLGETKGKNERYFTGISTGKNAEKSAEKSAGFMELAPGQLEELPFQ